MLFYERSPAKSADTPAIIDWSPWGYLAVVLIFLCQGEPEDVYTENIHTNAFPIKPMQNIIIKYSNPNIAGRINTKEPTRRICPASCMRQSLLRTFQVMTQKTEQTTIEPTRFAFGYLVN